MITSLTILSSLAIIVTAVIAFAEYQAGKRRHSTTLSIEMLHKQKDDFIKWFYDYLHISQVLMRVTIQLNMDRLEQRHFESTNDSSNQRRIIRINENTMSRDRNAADLNYQMMLLNLVIDVGARVGAVVMNRYMGMKGVKYFTGITLLDSLHGYVVAPMLLLAIVFLGITIGTLSQNRKEEEAVRNSYDSVTGI